MTDKKLLRKKFSALRKELSSASKDAIIAEKLLSSDFLSAADVILLYASFGSEIDTWKPAQKLLDAGKVIAFPKCGKNGHMTFHTVSDLSLLSDGMYGIREPDSSLPQPELTAASVCIVPGLAFTEKGERLGYGGGFYDRFLAAAPFIKTAALAYDDMITDELPVSEHDLAVDMIITEERTIYCNEQ